MTRSTSPPPPQASRIRLFRIILAVVPLLFFAAAELVLRAVDYGGDTRLVTRRTVNGKDYYALNRDAARVYFSQKGISIPELHDDLFTIRKSPMTKRIFMLGESTMAGFPFDYNATAPDQLRDRLRQLLPQYAIEVINVGVSAVNSYTIAEFLRELAGYEPDAIVLYLGHNEFYGAFGVGSSEYLGQSRFVIDTYLTLNRLKLFRLIRDGIFAARGWFAADVTPRQATLMEAMVRNKTIPYMSPEFENARRNFEENLTGMIRYARDRRIPVVLSTLASNVRDRAPFLSAFSPSTSDDLRQSWKREVGAGEESARRRDFDDAERHFRTAIAIDLMNAGAHFRLANCLDSLRRYDEAKDEYEKARDLDVLRFRASSDFNTLIRQVASREGVTLADAEDAFESASPHRLVGNSLMLEHLHPNFDGYALLAKSFCGALMRDSSFLPPDAYHRERDLSDDGYKSLAAVTPFDIEAANERIAELTRSWPFTDGGPLPAPRPPDDVIGKTAFRYVHKQIAWSQAHYDIAAWYRSRELFDSALTEYRAVGKVIPYSYLPQMQAGDMYRLMNRPDSALSAYTRALAAQNSPFVHVRLGMLYFEQNNFAKAIGEFETTLSPSATEGEPLDVRGRSMARYFLGAAYGRNGNVAMARTNLQMALQLDPDNKEARAMLEQLR